MCRCVYLVVDGAQRGLDVEEGMDILCQSRQEDDIKSGRLTGLQHLHQQQRTLGSHELTQPHVLHRCFSMRGQELGDRKVERGMDGP